MVSNIESLKEKCVFIHTSNESCVEDMVSNEELILGSDDVLPMICDTFVGDCELKVEQVENNIECAIEVSTSELNSYCYEQVEILTINVQNSPTDLLTLTNESQVDFIGFSKYFVAIEDNLEQLNQNLPYPILKRVS